MSKFIDTNWVLSVIVTLIISLNVIETLSQCGCGSSPQFQSPLHYLGTSEQVISERKKLRLDFMYYLGLGDKVYKGSEKTSASVDYIFHFLNFFGSYGISHYTSLDFNFNYNIRELNQFGFVTKGFGFSHISFGTRHTFYESEKSDFIVNAGGGIHIPLMKFKSIEQYPIVIQPSNGSFGAYAFGMLQKSFPELSVNFLLFARLNYNFKNDLNYHFAPTISLSSFISYKVLESLIALLEIRNFLAFQDRYNDTTYTNSGSSILSIVPRLTYKLDIISFSPFVEIPLFQYYKGEQIGTKISFGLNINYLLNFAKRKL